MNELSETLGLIDGWIRYDASTQRIEFPYPLLKKLQSTSRTGDDD